MSSLKKEKMEIEDRISSLSDCLLHYILSNLNIKQVVQTCVLSKRWKTLWTYIPTLSFLDDGSYGRAHPDPKSKTFPHFVLRVLSEHRGEHFRTLRYVGRDKFLIESLICYARRHNVREIYIHIHGNNTGLYNMKRCLSGCSSLTVLKISCSYVDYLGALALPSLKVVETVSFWVCNKGKNLNFKFENMFSGCPNLESLVLNDYGFYNASIYAPKLENLELCVSSHWQLTSPEIQLFAPNLKTVKFSNVLPSIKSAHSEFPCMYKVNIEVGDLHFQSILKEDSCRQKWIQNFNELLRLFRKARCFTLPLNSIQVALPLPYLKHLKLKTRIPNKGTAIDFPTNKLVFLQKCSNLETLVVLNEEEKPISGR